MKLGAEGREGKRTGKSEGERDHHWRSHCANRVRQDKIKMMEELMSGAGGRGEPAQQLG